MGRRAGAGVGGVCLGLIGLLLAAQADDAVQRTARSPDDVAQVQAGERAPGKTPGKDKPAPAKPVSADHPERAKAGLELFRTTVGPLLKKHCLDCHGGKSTKADFDLATRDGLVNAEALDADPDESLLYQVVAHTSEPLMPKGADKLPAEAIAAIRKWIELGAPYDKPLVESGGRSRSAAMTVTDADRDYWAFRPLTEIPLPEVKRQDWVRTPIDRFILAAQEQAGIAPNPEADKRTLIRRAYYDLLGLPPSPEEIRAFIDDSSPDAYERLLDRLLESPRYGERWARHWMDVSRFAESHGYEQDYDRPFAHTYRDFLIRAFNDDLPYDQFVGWQLAGDELAPQNPLAWTATGFLGAGAFPTQLTEAEFESARYDELDDMVGTMSSAFLGLSLGCARCHDHKFDPLPSADYYRMAAAFTRAIRSEMDLEFEPAGYAEQLAKWTAEHEPLVQAVARYEAEELPGKFEGWLADAAKKPIAVPEWVIAQPAAATSKGGANLAAQSDGSLLASGANADFDAYTFEIETYLVPRWLRVEALADASLVKGGPGRAANGNFALGTMKVLARPLGQADAAALPVVLKNPKADFEQNAGGLSIAASLDREPQTGWAVDPEFGKDHAAQVELEWPAALKTDTGLQLTVSMEFTVNNQHSIGRPRLSLSAAEAPGLLAKGALQNEVEPLLLLGKPGVELGASQKKALRDWFKRTDAGWLAVEKMVRDHVALKPRKQLVRAMVTTEGLPHLKHHADDRGFPHFYPQVHFLTRGDVHQKGAVAEVGFVQVLMRRGATAEQWRQPVPTGETRTGWTRASVAAWMTDMNAGAGPLVARVMVNRLWQHHFGRGIVATPNDFGVQGDRPTHPELLDWLAGDLVSGGWRLKRMHKRMMLSAAYRQSSVYDEARGVVDRENRLVWRRAPQRLEGEIIRDAMLSVSGMLDPAMYGPGTLDPNMRRRSVYFFIKRSQLIPSLMLFDWPEHLVSIGQRSSTTIAPQALLFLNGPQTRQYAAGFAERLKGKPVEEQVRSAYELALGRAPDERELAVGVTFVGQRSLVDFCQALFGLNEFVYVE